MTKQDHDLIKLSLTNCIAHLLEYIRPGGHPFDLESAANSLLNAQTQEYLKSLEPVLLPSPRDGLYPLTFPEPGE